MKLVKMSLAAAVLLGASAFAIDNIKVSGDAKVYYGTNDMGDGDLFDKGNEAGAVLYGQGSYADTALRLGVTGDLLKGISFGVTGYATSTLGLENNLVSNTWNGAHGLTTGNGSHFHGEGDPTDFGGVQVDDAAWIGELWLAATLGNTTAKVGRMELDTPLAFTEKWNIVPNTFEGAVLLNQDIPDTTLVAAWLGKQNAGTNAIVGVDTDTGNLVDAGDPSADLIARLGQKGGLIAPKGKFSTFGTDGAYAAAVVNNSFKPLTAQAWYYNVQNMADAFWLQADLNMAGVVFGAQYAEIDPKASGVDDTEAFAFKLGYEGIENLKLSAAYSEVDEKGAVPMVNVATGIQSKLYTEAMWNFGYVGVMDSKAWNAKASYDVKDIAKFCVSYTDVDNDQEEIDMKEIAVSVARSFGPLDARLAYISTDADDQNAGDRYNTIQAYLTLNF